MWRTPDEWASMIFKWVRNGKMHECQSYHICPLTGENSPSVKNMIKNS